MLTDKERALVDRQVESVAGKYLNAKTHGENLGTLALPTFDSQDDFQRCRPEDRGMPFEKHNELTVEILTALANKGIHAEPVVFRHAEFVKWLSGRPASREARADFAVYLLERERKGGVHGS